MKHLGDNEKIVLSRNLKEERIIELIKKNSYYYIQHIELTNERCLAAVKSNGSALKFIPKKMQTKEICLEAVNQCTSALRYVSKKYLDDEMYVKAALSNDPSLGYIPKEYITQEICNIAVSKKVRAISGVPEKYLSMDLRKEAIQADWRALGWITENKRSKRLCMKAYEEDAEAIKYFPKKFLSKEFCEEAVTRDGSICVHIPEKYHTPKILKMIEDSTKEEKRVDEEVVEQDVKFYEKHVVSKIPLLEMTPVKRNEIISTEAILHEADLDGGYDNSHRSIYYISDIHLNHKIQKKFPQGATELEIRIYLESIVDNMFSSMSQSKYSIFNNDFLLINGDVSFDFKISAIFYSLIAKKWNSEKVIVTLGNHELWDYGEMGNEIEPQSLDAIVGRYSELFSELGMSFLENNLLTLTYDLENPYGRTIILSEQEIMSITPEKLQEICNRSSLIVFGGIGYSGLNEEFNSVNGIYRSTIQSREDEIMLSNKTNILYKKLVRSIGEYKVIIQTHMPFSDWCDNEYHPGWIYVNGHNHRNEFFISQERTVFADNQIGYSNSNITLKRFNLSSNYDVFNNWEDGIYEIDRNEYLDFCKGVSINLNFNRRDGQIIMLKREGSYLFLFRNEEGKLYLLKGGRPITLDYNDVDYYYENMSSYAYAIKMVFKKYDSMLKKLSDFVRSFGGSGTVHGCIIDIDYYNHIYLNPFDGKVSPYFALSTIDKWVYKDIKSLLLEHCPELTDRYLAVTKDESVKIEDSSKKEYAVALSEYVPETDIYDPSRIIRSLQYLREVNVIREWDDSWLNKLQKLRSEEGSLQLCNIN